MRIPHLLTAVFSLALASLALADAASDVIDLSTANFQSVVDPEKLILVEFFAPWCGHCKALAPHYEEAATSLKEKGIKLAKVNCVDEPDLCQSHGVQGYPTLKVFRNGEPTEYTGPRKADGIVSYMIKQSLPAVSEVTAANLEEFKRHDKIVAVAYLSSTSDAPAAAFQATAEKHRDDYLFGQSTDAAAIEAAGVSPPSIILYRSFDDPVSVYPYPVTSATVEEIEGWIKELAIPVIDEVSAENYMLYAQSGKPLAYLFIDPTSELKDEYIERVRPVALEYKSKLNFIWIDAIKFGDHGKAVNLPESIWPSFVIQDLTKQLKYPVDQKTEITTAVVKTHVEAYIAGSLEPTLKSQPIPETQDEAVYTIVGKEFDKIVSQSNKHVFVEFFASWCGHCKRLKPTWDALGEHYAAAKDHIIIAKMEAPENDLPPSVPFRVGSFPTLKLKLAGADDWIDYDGDRSLESLIAFVDEHAKIPLKIFAGNESAPSHPDVEFHDQTHDEL
ncbi:thioredoxin-like protein [Russula earlei]|uniref:Thioredoxin-like protein n=1 Tax=Russula earlei TaxID=71964 RepID=A0ACC0UC71_9AGAM|nr:thioredoxin-like protein [Russula earlei]